MLFWVFAIGVYLLMTGLIVWRAIDDSSAPDLVQPDIWILMGGAAIATLAGDHIHKAGLESVRPVTVVTWIVATAWIPPLIYVTLHASAGDASSAGAVVGNGVPTGDVLVGDVCHGRRNRLAVADDGVAGVLLDRLRRVGHRRDRIAAAISAITRCGYSVRSSQVNRRTFQPGSAIGFCRSRSLLKVLRSLWNAHPSTSIATFCLGNATSTLYPPTG